MMKYLQNLGRSLMLPVAVLPAAAILMGIGNWILNADENNIIGNYLTSGGDAILSHLGILFAVGVAIGMSREQDGAAGLSGLVAWLRLLFLVSAGLPGFRVSRKVRLIRPLKISKTFLSVFYPVSWRQ